MYESISYEGLLQQMLAAVLSKNPNVDVREGSIVWLGQAPAAVEMQNLYIQLDTILKETFADTASREYLIKRAAERGIVPYQATRMIGQAEFTPADLDVPIDTRFNLNNLNYSVIEKLGAGTYKVECETAGEIGNEYLGSLIPIEYVNGLEAARLTAILIPGEDEERTESIRQRYFDSLNAQPFAGNVADYKKKVCALPGVGGVRVYRAWNGGIKPADFVAPAVFGEWLEGLADTTPPEIKTWLLAVFEAAQNGYLTVGGVVRLVIIDAKFDEPSDSLVKEVQMAIDPVESHAEGLGIAPIGHLVVVQGVSAATVNISTQITYQKGWLWDDVKAYAEEAVDAYFKELAESWADFTDSLVVRVSQIETRLLSCPGVLDIADTTINGASSNLVLEADSIPVRGEISG